MSLKDRDFVKLLKARVSVVGELSPCIVTCMSVIFVQVGLLTFGAGNQLLTTEHRQFLFTIHAFHTVFVFGYRTLYHKYCSLAALGQ